MSLLTRRREVISNYYFLWFGITGLPCLIVTLTQDLQLWDFINNNQIVEFMSLYCVLCTSTCTVC